MKTLIFIDVSGSMPRRCKDDVVDLFKNKKDVKLFVFDTNVAEINELNRWNSEVSYGGTDFNKIIEIVNAESPDQVFVITDGYGLANTIINDPEKWTWFLVRDKFTRWIDPQCKIDDYENIVNYLGNPL